MNVGLKKKKKKTLKEREGKISIQKKGLSKKKVTLKVGKGRHLARSETCGRMFEKS